MNINERFKGKILAPINDPAIIVGNNAGPACITVSLNNLVDYLPGNVKDGENTSQAIPNPLAHVTSFVTCVETVNKRIEARGKRRREAVLESLKEEERTCYFEWLGLSAVVALRGIYSVSGLDVEMEAIELNVDRILDSAILFALKNMGSSYSFFVDDGLGKGALYYLKQGGSYFAIYNDEIGLCPMRIYDRDIFEGVVPWFKNGKWEDPLAVLENNQFALECYKAWMFHMGFGAHVDAVGIANNLKNSFSALGWDTVNRELANAYSRIGNPNKANNFCQVCCAYTDANNRKNKLPALLTQTLVLAGIGVNESGEPDSSNLGYNDRNGEWKSLRITEADAELDFLKENFRPVLPFTEEAAQLYSMVFEINNLKFTAAARRENGEDVLASITAEFDLYLTGVKQSFIFSKTYRASENRNKNQIYKCDLPYLMVWPWIELPADSWNHFYALQMESLSSYKDIKQVAKCKVSLELTGAEVCNIQERGEEENWKVYQSSERFSYALLSAGVRGEKGDTVTVAGGVIMIQRIKNRADETFDEYTLSIDFGTTSTVCAIQPQGGKEELLTYQDYSKNMTIGNENMSEVAEKCWLGKYKKDDDKTLLRGKTLTVAQLFRDNKEAELQRGNDMPFITGRFFLASARILCRYAKSDNFNNFAARGIFNDLKFSSVNDIDEQRASTLFLAGVYTQALLYVLSQKTVGRITQLKVSYPSVLTLGNLKTLWNSTDKVINSLLTKNSQYKLPELQFFTEAEAAAKTNTKYVNNATSYINIDIGGGTTDVSIAGIAQPCRSGEESLSFKYAGRDMIIDTFIQLYRHWKGEESAGRKKNFEAIWSSEDSITKELIRFFLKQCDESDTATLNTTAAGSEAKIDSLRMAVEILLNDNSMTLPNDEAYLIIRSVITAKFIMLMYMVAEFIGEHKEALLPGCAGTRTQKIIPLVFTGAAAQILGHVFVCNVNDLKDLNSFDGGSKAALLQKLAEMIRAAAKIEEEVVVNLIISPAVKEKSEVAYGLLNCTYEDEGITDNRQYEPEKIIDLVLELEEEERKRWYCSQFQTKLYSAESLEEDLKDKLQNKTQLSNAALSINKLLNEKKVQQMITDAANNVEEVKKKVESWIDDWYGFIDSAKRLGLWLGFPAGGSDFGFGPGVTELAGILPKGDELNVYISICIRKLDADTKKKNYLASLENDRYRETMFIIYVVEILLNKSIWDKQQD